MSLSVEQRKKRQHRKRMIFRVICGILLFFLLLLAGMTYPELTGGRFPSWETVFSACGYAPRMKNDHPLRIHLCDVGAADAMLLSLGEHHILVDTGTSETADRVHILLAQENIPALDAIFLTHPHSDHMGAAASLLSRYPAAQVMLSGNPIDFSLPPNQPTTQLSAGNTISFGDLTVEILSTGLSTGDTNDASLILRVTYGDFSLLCMGDATTDVEADLLSRQLLSPSTVVKLGHHGSQTSTSEAFLDAVAPQHCLISCGGDAPAHSLVLHRLRQRSISYSRTDLDGTITLTTDGNHMKIHHEK